MFNYKTKKFYLYGYNDRARHVYSVLKNTGVKVVGYVDFNAEKINICGVISPESLYSIEEKDEYCIYICLQDAMKHESVAELMYRHGFNYVCFLPISDKFNDSAAEAVRTWNEIYNNGFNPAMNIMRYSEMIRSEIYSNQDVFRVPIELVFTSENMEGLYKRYEDKNIGCFEPYNQLYRYIYKGGELPETYINDNISRYGKTKDGLLKNRVMLYEALRKRILIDSEYYRALICPVKINQKGYFNLLDGHHRANLLYNLGYDDLFVYNSGEGEINYSHIELMQSWRNVGLFRMLVDIVEGAENIKRCVVITKSYKESIKNYFELLFRHDDFDYEVYEKSKEIHTNADLKIYIRKNLDGYTGQIEVECEMLFLPGIKQAYVIDNCIYYVSYKARSI